MGDMGGYGIAELPPTGPLLARGHYQALGQKGKPWEVVRNSISAHVTHAEITLNMFYKKRSKKLSSLDFAFLYSGFLFSMTHFG